jgi:2-dehydro-3-deoxygluconokinase
VLPLVDRADLVLGGEQELASLVGPGEPEVLARRCAARGPREVVVRGKDRLGALAPSGEWSVAEISRRDDAVDAVGAGDAFNAGYLAVRLRGGPVAAAFRAGVFCGTAVAMALGDTAGFPRRTNVPPELRDLLGPEAKGARTRPVRTAEGARTEE